MTSESIIVNPGRCIGLALTPGAEVKRFGERVAEARSRRQVGSIFEDLSPEARRALLEEAHAEGIVQAKLVIPGRVSSVSPVREDNTVQVRVGMGEDGSKLGWISRCERVSGLNPTVAIALDDAARCAIQDAIAQTGH